MNEKKTLWPGWEVVRRISGGSFGTVYEIERDIFGRREKAALKVISIPKTQDEIIELYNDGNSRESITTYFKEHLEAVVQEYSLMLEMKGHTNVVCCDDLRYEQHSDGIGWDVFIKMELLTPLKNAVGEDYNEQQTIRLGMDMCNALVLCKHANIVHRDIKPQNIFVSKTGDYKLGDFGVAKISDRTSGGTKSGTYEYMAPEVYHGQAYGSGADICSLGLVLYWMMNGKRTPFLPISSQIPSAVAVETALGRRFRGETLPEPACGSEELKRIVLKACAFDPKQRYLSAAAMLEDLKKLNTGVVAMPVVNTGMPIQDEPTDRTEDGRYEKTVNIFGTKPVPAQAEEEPTLYLPRNEKTERTVPEQVQPAQKPKKKSSALPWLLVGAFIVVLILCLLLRSCDGSQDGQKDETIPSTGQTSMSEPSESETQPSTGPENQVTEPSTEATEPSTEVTEPSVDITEPTVGTQIVPNVVGFDQSFAKSAMEAWGFNVVANEVHSDTVRKGVVMSQNVSAGSKAEVGTTIILTVSLGPELTLAPIPDKDSKTYSMMINGSIFPDGDANNAFVNIVAGETFRLTVEDDKGVEQNVVWSLSHEGVVSFKDSTVTGLACGVVSLTASYKGQHFDCTIGVREATHSDRPANTQVVPDVTGDIEFDAVSELEALGFKVEREYVYSSSVPLCIVMDQDIAAGTSAEIGTTVTLTVSRGPDNDLTLAPPVED